MTVTRPSAEVGLCAQCRHAAAQRNARGSGFLRCLRAESDRSYPRYPPLPVEDCPGFELDDSGSPEPTGGRHGPSRSRNLIS